MYILDNRLLLFEGMHLSNGVDRILTAFDMRGNAMGTQKDIIGHSAFKKVSDKVFCLPILVICFKIHVNSVIQICLQ